MTLTLQEETELRNKLSELTNTSGWQEEFADDPELKERFIKLTLEMFPPEIIKRIIRGATITCSEDPNFYDIKIDTADLFRCLNNSTRVRILEVEGIEPKADFSCKYLAVLYEMKEPDWRIIYDKSAPYEKCASERYGLIYSLKQGERDKQTLLIFE